jgi:hypothetical protein
MDVIITWKGLGALPAEGIRAFNPQVMLFAPSRTIVSWAADGVSADGVSATVGKISGMSSTGGYNKDNHKNKNKNAGGVGAGVKWVNGTVNGGGPLALRLGQDTFAVRVLVDGSVVETFWDGGRARTTANGVYPSDASATGLQISSGGVPAAVTADVDVWEMGNMWIKPAITDHEIRRNSGLLQA